MSPNSEVYELQENGEQRVHAYKNSIMKLISIYTINDYAKNYYLHSTLKN